ncbi:MAG: hypothetical protein ACRDRX_09460 [Pseudonocardiaceae bacterium]
MAETAALFQPRHPVSPTASDSTTSTSSPTSIDTPTTGTVPAGRTFPKPRWSSGATVLALIIAIVANLAVIAVIASRTDPTPVITARPPALTLPGVLPAPPAPAVSPAPATSPALPSTLATTFGEGRFVVGTDIAPGTYQTTGKSGRSDCYWERLKDTNGTTASIIDNDLAPGPATVTIDQTDGAFQTRWCRTWTKVS